MADMFETLKDENPDGMLNPQEYFDKMKEKKNTVMVIMLLLKDLLN